MGLLEEVLERIAQGELAPAGARIVVAISGGVDSMVLLDILVRLAPERRWTLRVAHFNHQLRGAESDGDELFVRDAAARYGLPFEAGRGNVAETSRAKHLSVEMAARELRHGFLAATAHSANAILALAHHADDQVETFWLRILRGEAGGGFAGMRRKTRSPADLRVTLIRPLLETHKRELESYAKERGLEYREDSSNKELHFQRNYLRHVLLPQLEQFQPQLAKVTLRTAEVLLAEKEFVTTFAREWLQLPGRRFSEIHTAVQREVVRLQLHQMSIRPDYGMIEELRAQRKVTVAPGEVLQLEPEGVLRKVPVSEMQHRPGEIEIALGSPGTSKFGQIQLQWEIVSERGTPEAAVEYFDADAIGGTAVLRHWQPGDEFQPIGNPRPSKLQDLFTNLKVPVEARRSRVLAQAASGEIFWVQGLRIGERFKVRPESRRVLKWNWRESRDALPEHESG